MHKRNLNYLLLYHCAPTIYKKKAANIFSIQNIDDFNLTAVINEYEKILNYLNLKLCVLCTREKNTLFYIYSEKALLRIISTPKIKNFLKSHGYNEFSVEKALNFLISRFDSCIEFPHEIGIFLDYPLEDVKSFIQNKGQNFLHCGCWKVYHNPDDAIYIFKQYEQCRIRISGYHNAGMSAADIVKLI